MAGMKPNNFPLVTPTGTTELYTQTNNVNGKFTLDDVKDYLNEWTEIVVDITASQILNMGSSPIELLPAPGDDKYYQYQILLEKDNGTISATSGGFFVGTESYTGVILESGSFTSSAKSVAHISSNNTFQGTNGTEVYAYPEPLNQKIQFFTWLGSNPVSATANFKAKIKYKIETFG